MKTIKYILFSVAVLVTTLTLGSLLSANEYQGNEAFLEQEKDQSKFIGRWSPDCENIGGITISNEKDIRMEVNRNQIYILSHGIIEKEEMKIFLDGPDDLGKGGMMLDWDNFSRTHKLIEFSLLSNDSANIEWLGFYNFQSKSREWRVEPDFMEGGNRTFLKCRD